MSVEVDRPCEDRPGFRGRIQLYHLQDNADTGQGQGAPHVIDRKEQDVDHQMIPHWF
jgi:hypothetical protein